jgi:hypothetical protein
MAQTVEGVKAFRQRLAAPGVIENLVADARFLEASEYQLILLMQANSLPTSSNVINPGGLGHPEFGLMPYLIHNPPDWVLAEIERSTFLTALWKVLETLIYSQIQTAHYSALMAAAKSITPWVGPDGTVYGTATYEQLDPKWLWAVIDYLISRHKGDIVPFGTTPQTISLTAPQGSNQVTIALMGDWGTGPNAGGATAVMKQIAGLGPNYIVHLGDVYYAGTAGLFLPLNEEQDNFLDVWPPASQRAAGTSFMLNSNHEMYAGDEGYFNVALQDGRFAAQAGTSYFALQYGGLNLLGLDTAYYSNSPLYMLGSIGGTTGAQAQWIQSLGLTPGNVIVLSHHNGLMYDGSAEEPVQGTSTTLPDEINSALGGDPAAWYWGHEHMGVAYASPTVTGRATLCRCLGHGALPIGNPSGVPTSVPYCDRTASQGVLIQNGFVLLTITSQGQVTEEFYEVGSTTPAYSNTYAPGGG